MERSGTAWQGERLRRIVLIGGASPPVGHVRREVWLGGVRSGRARNGAERLGKVRFGEVGQGEVWCGKAS